MNSSSSTLQALNREMLSSIMAIVAGQPIDSIEYSVWRELEQETTFKLVILFLPRGKKKQIA